LVSHQEGLFRVLLAFFLAKGFQEYLGDLGKLGAYPGLEAVEGAEVIVGNCPRAFPLGHREPAPQYLAGWLAGGALHFGLAGMTGKLSLLFVHFSPTLKRAGVTAIGGAGAAGTGAG